jgi:hypothetical protein
VTTAKWSLVDSSVVSVRSRLTLTGTPFDSTEFSRLWTLAAATYGVGDIVTTVALLHFDEEVGEANVLLQWAVDSFGNAGLIGLKLAVFFFCLAICLDAAHREDSLVYYLPPVALTLVGAFTTVFNIRLLLG